MKYFIIIGALACVSAASFAQVPATAPSTPPAISSAAPLTPAQSPLSLEDRKELMDASQQAQQTPEVKAAVEKQQAAVQAVRALLISKDSSLTPLLDKVMPVSPVPGAQRPYLTLNERGQLREAHKSIEGTPESAALDAAGKEYINALTRAMITVDPGVVHVFAKLSRAHHMAAQSGPGPAASGPAVAAPAAAPALSSTAASPQ